MKNMEIAYNWLNNFRVENRMSFKKMGDLISYSDVGFSKALKNKTLSIEQIKIIAGKVDKKEELNNLLNNQTNNTNFSKIEVISEDQAKYTTGLDQFSKDQIAVYLINNHDEFAKSKTYQLYKKDVIDKEAKALLEREYGDVIAELKRLKEKKAH